jgi:hypothetical protein
MSDTDNLFGVDPIIEDGQVEQEETLEEQEESTPEGQVEEEQEQIEEDQEEQHQEDNPLILGKFKSQDDLVSAYRNLEKEHTRLRMSQKAPEQKGEPKETQDQANEEQQLLAWYNEEMQSNPANANAVLSQYIAKKQFEEYKSELDNQYRPIIEERTQNQQIAAVANEYEDFYDYSDGMTQEIDALAEKESPLLNDPNLYEIIYHRAKNRVLEEKFRTAFDNGKKSALNGVKQKKQVTNEQSKANKNEDTLPDGINIIPNGDGIFT